MPELSLEAILAIIAIIVAIFIPCAFFFLRRYLKYKEIYNKYYSIVWKRFFSLKPEDLIGRRRFHKYYYDRPEDIRIQQCLKQNKKIFLKGKPLSGKSRSIFQALLKSEKHYDVLIPRCVDIEHQDFIIPKHIKFWRPKVIIIDDMHEFVEKQNFKYLIEKCLQNSTNIIASCRSGGEFEKVQNKMTQFNLDLQFIFENNIIDIKKISEEEGKKIAEKVGITWETVGFNRTVGSIFMELPEMKRRFKEDCDEEEKHILRIIKNLYGCGIYEEFQHFPINWIIEISKRDRTQIKENELYNILEKLQDREFLKIEENKKISTEQVYFEEIVEYQYPISKYDVFEETLHNFYDAKLTTPIWKLGARSLSLSGISSYDQKEFLNLSVKSVESIIKIYSLNESLIEKEEMDVLLCHLLFRTLYMIYSESIDEIKKLEIFQNIINQSDIMLTINPKNLFVWDNKGYALLQLERFKEANECYDKVLKINSKFNLVYFDKGVALINLEKYEEAIVYIEKASDIEPRSHIIWFKKGLVYYFLGKLNEAVSSLNMAYLINPKDKQTMYWNGVFNCQSGDYKEAIKYLDELLEIDPENKEAWKKKGDSHYGMGEYKEAINCYNKALEIEPEYKDAWKIIGKSHHSMEAYNEAINCYDKALEIEPEDKEIWYNKSKSLNLVGEFEEAIKCCDEALKIDSEYTDALCQKGILLYDHGDFDEAIKYCDEALKIDPEFTLAWVVKGISKAGLNKHKDALTCYDKALEIDQNYKLAWFYKGNSTYELDKKEALICYDKVLEIDPEYKDAWAQKGYTLTSLNRYNDALECFDKAVELDPEYKDAWARKGYCLHNLKRYDQANECYDKVLKLDENYDMAWYNKACLESLWNNKERSIEFLKKAIELNNYWKNFAKTDTDFINIKNTIEFKDLIEEKILLEQI